MLYEMCTILYSTIIHVHRVGQNVRRPFAIGLNVFYVLAGDNVNQQRNECFCLSVLISSTDERTPFGIATGRKLRTPHCRTDRFDSKRKRTV